MIATSTGIVSESQSRKIAGHGRFQHSGTTAMAQRSVVMSVSAAGTQISTASSTIAHLPASNGGLGGGGGSGGDGIDDGVSVSVIHSITNAALVTNDPLGDGMPNPLIIA